MQAETEARPERERGQIAKLVYERGFGFIKRKGDRPDLFFHISSLDERAGKQFRNLHFGQFVTYEEGVADRTGLPVATNVWPL